MKYLRSPQDSLLGFCLKFSPAALKTSLYVCSVCAGLTLPAPAAQADSALPYQPALGNYQRFEQDSAASPAQSSPAHDHAKTSKPNQAAHHDHASHETHAPVSHDHQQHDMSAHEHSHANEQE